MRVSGHHKLLRRPLASAHVRGTCSGPRRHLTAHATTAAPPACRYVPFDDVPGRSYDDLVVLDCRHSSAPTLTHHRGHSNVAGCVPGDTTTAMVLGTLALDSPSPQLADVLTRPRVTVNHFDEDAALAMWCWLHRDECAEHAAVLRTAARIGDFGDVLLPAMASVAGFAWPPPEATADGVASDSGAVHAGARLACWITQQAPRVQATAGQSATDAQFEFFLARLGAALREGPPAGEWEAEHAALTGSIAKLQEPGVVSVHQDVSIGVTFVEASVSEPLHACALDSVATGTDVVAHMYPGGYYGLRCRYTGWGEMQSRAQWPRLPLEPLAMVLNELEQMSDGGGGVEWQCDAHDSLEPSLRLVSAVENGPPPKSALSAAAFKGVVQSFFRVGLSGAQPQLPGHSWVQMRELHRASAWGAWRQHALREHNT